MPNPPEESLFILKKLLSEIIDDINQSPSTIIIVEGKNDKRVLIDLMAKPTKIIVLGSLSIQHLTDLLDQYEKIYLFLDRDKAGLKKTYHILRLTKKRKIINIWDLVSTRLRKYGFKSITKVEELKIVSKILRNTPIHTLTINQHLQ